MKLKLVSTAALLLAIAGCTQKSETGISRNNESADAFQRRSIMRVGLNKKLALTFDDGPATGPTTALLDLLEQEGIKATFFVNGKNIRGRESIMGRMNRDGHVVANHSQTHAHLPRAAANLGMRQVYREVHDTALAIQPYLQDGGRQYFRAPHGAWQSSFADYLNRDQLLREYIGPIFWDIGGEISKSGGRIARDSNGNPLTAADWDCWTPTARPKLSVRECAAGYLNETRRRGGGIVLMHDKTMSTVEMVRRLIPKWREEGYEFVTLDEVEGLDRYVQEHAN